ncbi:MAG: hypothetical protein AB1432_04485 [Bacteroidota bacterium]
MNDILANIITKNKCTVRLTYERWSHIVESHDYMAGNLNLVIDTIEEPDYIVKGNMDALIAVKHFKKTNISEKYSAAVYKEGDDNFVITAFLTSDKERIIKKGVLWQK